MRRLRRMSVGALVTVGSAVVAPPAHAVPDCVTPLPAPVPVLSGQGTLESVIVDARGRLFYTDQPKQALMRVDRPGGTPVQVAGGIDAPGGLAFDADGRHLFVGRGDSLTGGLAGNLSPAASLLRVDVETGSTTTFATGLRMANGLVRAADGTLYASTDVGTSLDRIAPGGAVQSDWAAVVSANGLAIDAAQRHLYANQTFVPAAIVRVDLMDPSRVTTIFQAGGTDVVAALDGMTIDPDDRLVVAANAIGEVWRVTPDGVACALGRGLTSTSAVAYGQGPDGFSAGRLFAVGFDGVLAEIPAGRLEPAGAPAAPTVPSVTLLPRRARVLPGSRVRLTLRVTVNGRRVARRVRIGDRTLRTGRPAILRVTPATKTLTATFTIRGKRISRKITLIR